MKRPVVKGPARSLDVLEVAIPLIALGLGSVWFVNPSLSAGLLVLCGLIAWLIVSPFEPVLVWSLLLLPQWLAQTPAGLSMLQATIGGLSLGLLLNWLFIGVCAIQVVWPRVRVRWSPGFVFYGLLALVYAALLPAGISRFGVDAVYSFTRIVGPLLLGLFAAHECRINPKRIDTLFVMLCISVIAVGAYASVGGASLILRNGPAQSYGLLGWPSSLGYFSAMGLSLIAVRLRDHQQRPFADVWLMKTAVVVGLLGVAFSFSRGAWVALLVSAVVLSALGNRSAVAIVIALAAAVMAVPVLSGRATELAEQLATRSHETGSGRIQIWGIVWGLVSRRWLTGYGIGSYFISSKPLFAGTLTASFPHSDPLFLWFEAGVLAPVLLLAQRIAWLVEGIRHSQASASTSPSRLLWRGVAAATAVVLVGHLIDNVLFVSAIQSGLAIAVGGVWGASTPDVPAEHESWTPRAIGRRAQ